MSPNSPYKLAKPTGNFPLQYYKLQEVNSWSFQDANARLKRIQKKEPNEIFPINRLKWFLLVCNQEIGPGSSLLDWIAAFGEGGVWKTHNGRLPFATFESRQNDIDFLFLRFVDFFWPKIVWLTCWWAKVPFDRIGISSRLKPRSVHNILLKHRMGGEQQTFRRTKASLKAFRYFDFFFTTSRRIVRWELRRLNRFLVVVHRKSSWASFVAVSSLNLW